MGPRPIQTPKTRAIRGKADLSILKALRQLVVERLAERWSTRHTDMSKRSPRFTGVRLWLLDRYFDKLLS